METQPFFSRIRTGYLTWLHEKLNVIPVKRHSKLEVELKASKSKFIFEEKKLKERIDENEKHFATQIQIYKCKMDENEKHFAEQLQIYKGKMERIVQVDKEFGFNIFDILKIKSTGTKVNNPVVPPQRLSIRDDMIIKFKAYKDKINAKEELKPMNERNLVVYSPEQEKMIFSDNSATCILAGAGSGKSTALILRVIFFREYLQIPFEQITVCTFTKESRKDFIKKLQLRFRQWDRVITEYQAKSIVRTFHSLAYQMHLKLCGHDKKIMFDFDSQKPLEGDVEGLDIENGMELPDVLPLKISKTVQMQIAIYKNLYTYDEGFRSSIKNLYVSYLRETKREKEFNNTYPYTDKYEDLFAKICMRMWQETKLDGSLNIERFLCEEKDDVGGFKLNYHLYLPNMVVKIFLNCTWQEFGDDVIPSTKKFLKYLTSDREALCAKSASNNYILVETVEELRSLIQMEDSDGLKIKPTDTNVPIFPFACKGDFITRDKINKVGNEKSLIYMQISQIINFSYSIGMPLYTFSDDQLDKFFSKCSIVDQCFIRLSKTFHKAWVEQLTLDNLTTFDEVFYKLGNSEHPAYKRDDIHNINKLNHLIIDEFQDISKCILQFLGQLKTHLVLIQISKNGSLTCVGDDYQSIYGWRGSSAQFILKFEECFNLSHYPYSNSFIDNYRSAALILEAGALVTDRIRGGASRKGYRVKANDNKESEVSCQFYRGVITDGNKYPTLDFERAIEVLKTEISRLEPTKDNPIYLLLTTRSVWKKEGANLFLKFIEMYEKTGQLKRLTIHSSKGLEGKCVIVLGDIRNPDIHPVRNGFYEAANMDGSYHNMQIDEAYRVAYVGITRAKSNLHWFFISSEFNNNLISFLLDEKKFAHLPLSTVQSSKALPA